MRMATPQISSHRYSRDEMANEDRLPSERMEHWLREHHGSPPEAFCSEDKEEQHTKSEIRTCIPHFAPRVLSARGRATLFWSTKAAVRFEPQGPWKLVSPDWLGAMRFDELDTTR